MITLLLSGAVLLGVGTTERMGEDRPSLVLSADARYRSVSVEATWDGADKLESPGWLGVVAGDWHSGPLTLGAAWSHRETEAWTKDRLFVRAGVQHGPLWLLASIAPDSPNMEARLEARLRLAHKWARLEPRAWVGTHSMAEEIGGYAYGFSLLAGWGR